MVRVKIERSRRSNGDGSFFTALLGNPLHDIAKLARRKTAEIVRKAMGHVVSSLVAGALFITAVVFLLIAGVEGLRAASLPTWLAYLILGVVAVGAGLLFLNKSTGGESESD